MSLGYDQGGAAHEEAAEVEAREEAHGERHERCGQAPHKHPARQHAPAPAHHALVTGTVGAPGQQSSTAVGQQRGAEGMQAGAMPRQGDRKHRPLLGRIRCIEGEGGVGLTCP